MFCQNQVFPTEKKSKMPDVFCFFLFKKNDKYVKKARISKSGFNKAKLATLQLC